MPSASFVFPVRYVSEGVAVQTTSRELSPLGIAVRSLSPPQVGARVSMALYLPNAALPEVAIGRVSVARAGAPLESGFWADFIVVCRPAAMASSVLPVPALPTMVTSLISSDSAPPASSSTSTPST